MATFSHTVWEKAQLFYKAPSSKSTNDKTRKINRRKEVMLDFFLQSTGIEYINRSMQEASRSKIVTEEVKQELIMMVKLFKTQKKLYRESATNDWD